MYRYAEYIRRELLDVKGVKRINIVGNRDEVINIILSKEQIARNGIVPTQIISALQQAGKTVNAGKYRSNEERIALYVDSPIDNEEEIRNLSFRTMDGKTMRIGDIARVERGYAEPQRNGFFVNGQPSLAICLAMESSAIVPDVGQAVDNRLEEVNAAHPGGLPYGKDIFPARESKRGHLVVHVEPGRIGPDRHSGTCLHHGTAQWPDHRLRTDTDRGRIIPDTACLRYNAATHLARGLHCGNGYAGR